MTEQTPAADELSPFEADTLERMRTCQYSIPFGADEALYPILPVLESLVSKGYAVEGLDGTTVTWRALPDGPWPSATARPEASDASASSSVDDLRAEVHRLTEINRELVETHNNHLVRIADLEHERDGLRAQQRAVLDLCAAATVRDDADAVLDLVAQVREALPYDVPETPAGPDAPMTALVGNLARLCDDEWLRRRDRLGGTLGARHLPGSAASEIEYAAFTIRQLIKTLPGYDSDRSAQAYVEWMSSGRDQVAWH